MCTSDITYNESIKTQMTTVRKGEKLIVEGKIIKGQAVIVGDILSVTETSKGFYANFGTIYDVIQ